MQHLLFHTSGLQSPARGCSPALGTFPLSSRRSPEKHPQFDLKTSRDRARTNYLAARSSA